VHPAGGSGVGSEQVAGSSTLAHCLNASEAKRETLGSRVEVGLNPDIVGGDNRWFRVASMPANLPLFRISVRFVLKADLNVRMLRCRQSIFNLDAKVSHGAF
jgi:hypothetical protein